MYTLSPFVVEHGGEYEMFLRAVPRRDDDPRLKIAEIYRGASSDGLRFAMDALPAIAPGPEAVDGDGCEDPTVVIDAGTYFVYYTGWNETRKVGNLLLASGRDPRQLEKRGIAIASAPGRTNPKEATVVRAAAGRWLLFFEYADAGASKVGIASANAAGGPWQVQAPPFSARRENWDAWHLSPGPVVVLDGQPLMFYNGATRDAKWRVGCLTFDATFTTIVDRCDGPLITPTVETGATDIAFAASAVLAGEDIWLYYSVSDQELRRATLRRR